MHLSLIRTDIGAGPDGAEYAVKFHRLGRTSFRTVKKNRDYLRNRRTSSWLYLSRLAALKEFAFMKVLHEHSFPVPRPIDVNRHVVVMELLQNHFPLSQIRELRDPPALFGKLMELLVRLAEAGLIHGDFNEFNLLIHEETEEPVIIDFPQMVSIRHANAAELFSRDVACLVAYFLKRFKFQAAEFPQFEKDVTRTQSLDVEVEASGFSKEQAQEFDELLRAQAEDSSQSDDESESEEEDALENELAGPSDRDLAAAPGSSEGEDSQDSVEQKPSAEPAVDTLAHQESDEPENLSSDSEDESPVDTSDRRIVAQRVRAQLQRKRQRQKVATRNNYKGREKRKLQEEANAWAAEKSYSGW